MSNESNDWSFITGSHPLSLSAGASPPPPHNTPSHLKPPVDLATIGIHDEENDSPIYLAGGPFPCLQRLATPTEESYNPFAATPSGNVREEQPAYGNSLGAHGAVLEQGQEPITDQVQGINPETVQGISPDQVQNIGSEQVQGINSEVQGAAPDQLQNLSSDQLVQSVTTDMTAAIDDNNHQRNIFVNDNTSSPVSVITTDSTISINSSIINFVVEPKIRSVINGDIQSPPVNSSNSFPPEPTILADKYIILGPVDNSTCHGISLRNHDAVHVKAVSPRTARDVCSQQALLLQDAGVRAPMEAVVSECGKRAWLVFPLHFGDLHSYVRLKRRLREAEAQRLFAQVVTTVHNCHSSGLVLRDLKLRKFVFTDSNRQHVVLESVEDSVVAGESDLLHDKHGCPAYVAPEILSSSAYSGRNADMWGLGVILYTMLVGRYPFHNADTSALFAKIRSGKFYIPEWVSSRARHLILSLLRRQPQRRLTALKVLVHPWLNRVPRDHVGKDVHDHIVPSDISAPCVVGKSSKR